MLLIYSSLTISIFPRVSSLKESMVNLLVGVFDSYSSSTLTLLHLIVIKGFGWQLVLVLFTSTYEKL